VCRTTRSHELDVHSVFSFSRHSGARALRTILLSSRPAWGLDCLHWATTQESIARESTVTIRESTASRQHRHDPNPRRRGHAQIVQGQDEQSPRLSPILSLPRRGTQCQRAEARTMVVDAIAPMQQAGAAHRWLNL
jgi:hypothetical protein